MASGDPETRRASLSASLSARLTPHTQSRPVSPSVVSQPRSFYLGRCPPVRRALPVRAAGELRAGNFCSAPCSPAEELPTTSAAPPAPPPPAAVPPATARWFLLAITHSRADALKHVAPLPVCAPSAFRHWRARERGGLTPLRQLLLTSQGARVWRRGGVISSPCINARGKIDFPHSNFKLFSAD